MRCTRRRACSRCAGTNKGSATALGQLAFFAEYLEATGLFEAWRKSCPLSYTSPNAPGLVDVLGTWMLSILEGQCRYAHVGAHRTWDTVEAAPGEMRIIAFITEGPAIREIPGHLGEPTSPPRLRPARGPPLWEMPGSEPDEFDPQAQPEPNDEF